MDTIAGYRLIRLLGEGRRAKVYLAHASAADGSDSQPVAIKVYNSQTAREDIDAEIAVLTMTVSRHLLSLRDIATTRDGRACIVLPRLGGGTLSRLLRVRDTLELGEAITILAPLCDALTDLHRSGYCHGAIRPEVVLFDDSGAPVLACFGDAVRLASAVTAHSTGGLTPAQLSAEPRVDDDLVRLTELAAIILRRVHSEAIGGRCAYILEWLTALTREARAGDVASQLRDRLWGLGPASPIALILPEVHDNPVQRLPMRLTGDGNRGEELRTENFAFAPRNDGVSIGDRLRTWIVLTVHRASAKIVIFRKVKAVVASVRLPFRLAGLAALCALIITFAMLMPTPGRPVSKEQEAPVPAATSTSKPSPGVTRSATPVNNDETATDDPVAALDQLLERRNECFRTRSVRCLAVVDQVGSAAQDDDSNLVRSLQQGVATSEIPLSSAATASLSQRLGDSALLTLQVSADNVTSVLLVKAQGLWRIRSFMPQ